MGKKRPYKEYKRVVQDQKEHPVNPDEQRVKVDEFVQDFATSLKRDVLQAQVLATLAAHTGQYQPILSEQLTQEININPSTATSEEISMWLMNPTQYSRSLRSLSQYLENAVGQYNRAVHYFADMLSFNCGLFPKDVNVDVYVSDEETKRKFKNSYFKACDILAKMKPRDRFHAMALATMQDGVSFWWLEESNTEISFLQLPTDFCYITSKWAMGWTAAIDLSYFDRMLYTPNIIPELQKAYQAFIKKREEGFTGKDLAPYQYYAMPSDKCWVLTFDPNKASKIPPLAPTFGSALDLISYRQLLKDKSALELWKVLAAKIPMKRNTDEMAMPYGEAANIVAMIQATLPDNISVFATPFEVDDIVTNQVGTMDNIVDLSNNTFYSSMGTTGGFFGESDNDSAKAILLNQEIDYYYVAQPLYTQFNNMVNWYLNLKVNPYHWSVRFTGNNLTKRDDIATALKLVTTANFPMSTLATAYGMLPHELNGLVVLEDILDVKDKMTPLQSQFQTTTASAAEKKSDLELSDEGEATRDSRGIA